MKLVLFRLFYLAVNFVKKHKSVKNSRMATAALMTTKHAGYPLPSKVSVAYIEMDVHTIRLTWLRTCINRLSKNQFQTKFHSFHLKKTL